MAKDALVRLKFDSKEYDAKIERARRGLMDFEDSLRKAGKTFKEADAEQVKYAQSLGQMPTVARTARGALSELTKAYTDLTLQYKKLSEEDKASDVGKGLNASLGQLKSRILDAKKDLAEIGQDLGGAKGATTDFSGALGDLVGSLGISGDLIKVVTTGTVAYTAAIGAAVTGTIAAAKAFAEYNIELGRQQQVTSVTTGLQGPDADRMTASARALANIYGTDFREVINAANTLMTQFGQTSDQAMQLIRDGMQGMILGDAPKLLSMIQQYAPAFQSAGVSASQLMAIIQNSEGGIFTDQNMNAIVMGVKNIRLMTKQTSEALANLGIDGQKMSQDLNDGTLTVFDALKQVAGALEGVNSNSQTAGEVMQTVFGRQGTMAGNNLSKAIATLNTDLNETKRQTGELGEQYAKLAAANERLEVGLMATFGYKGWDEMATGIKTELVSALAGVLTLTADLKNSWMGQLGDTIFDSITRSIQVAITTARGLLTLMGRIGNSSSSGGASAAQYGGLLGSAISKGGSGSTVLTVDPKDTIIKQLQEQLAEAHSNKGSTAATPAERASAAITAAELEYSRAMEKAALEVQGGIITEAQQKQKQLQALEALWTAYGKASDTVNGSNVDYKSRQEQLGQRIVALGSEVVQATEAQKAAQKAARELEHAQEKMADAKKRLAEARMTGSVTAVYKAQQNIDKLEGKEPQDTGSMYGSLKQSVQDEIKFDQMKADEATLRSLLKTAMQNSLDSLDVDFAGLQAKIAQGIDIPDKTWQSLQEEINKKLAALEVDPIEIDFKTGKLKDSTQNARQTQLAWSAAASAVSNLGSALQSLEDPSAKIAGIVGQAVANIALGFAQAAASPATGAAGVFGWIAAATAGVATMTATIAQIKSVTAGSYAEGGIVPGHNYNDGLIANVSSGELILNRAQQANIANQLKGPSLTNFKLDTYVSGRDLRIVLNNDGKSRGIGRIVTSNNFG